MGWGVGGGGRGRRISVASNFDLLLLKLSGYEAFLPDHPTSFKSISCQFCSSFYNFSSSLYPLTFLLLLLLLLLLLFHFLFLPFCCQFQRIFANFSPGAEGGGIFGGWGAREGGGGGIRLITSHTERTKFFIAWKKAASFRDTLVRRKSLGWWDLSFQNFFTKGMF